MTSAGAAVSPAASCCITLAVANNRSRFSSEMPEMSAMISVNDRRPAAICDLGCALNVATI